MTKPLSSKEQRFLDIGFAAFPFVAATAVGPVTDPDALPGGRLVFAGILLLVLSAPVPLLWKASRQAQADSIERSDPPKVAKTLRAAGLAIGALLSAVGILLAVL